MTFNDPKSTDIEQREAALRKWANDGAVVQAALVRWQKQGQQFNVRIDAIDEERGGSLIRRIVVRDPHPRYIDLIYYLRFDNQFQAHWGAGIGKAEFFGFSPQMYEESISTHLSMIFRNRGWSQPDSE